MKFLRFLVDILRRARLEVVGTLCSVYSKSVFLMNDVPYGTCLRVRGMPVIHVHREGTLRLGNNCRFNSGYRNNFVGGEQRLAVQVLPGGSICLGDGVAISNSTLVASSGIEIGDDVFIGGGCHIYDTDFHSINREQRTTKVSEVINSAPIHVKSGAFIGSHSIVLKGVVIGRNSVVASGAVVTRSIPDNEVWGGVPASFIRKL